MAQYVTIDQFKKHLNIDFVSDGDDAYLTTLLDAAEERIEKEINQSLSVFVKDDNLSRSLVAAILIFAGTLYANREAVSYTQASPVPYTLSYLIQPFIKYA